MIPQPVDYAAPRTVVEAVSVLAANQDARPLAGGQCLLAGLQTGDETAGVLVDLRRIPGLRGIRSTPDGGLEVGAMTTLYELATDPVVRSMVPALAEAAGAVGDPPIRNRATIGGNLAPSHGGTDLPAVALALDAHVRLAVPGGERDLSFAEYVLSERAPRVITAVSVPARAPHSRSAFEKLAQQAVTLPVTAVCVELTVQGNIVAARVARTGPNQLPVRLDQVEEALIGTDGDRATVLAAFADLPSEPFEGMSGYSAEYVRHVTGVLTSRAVRRIMSGEWAT
ncbi:MAG TPA: FAD binding domain-containing protein [Pseudonocardiaceae bacterium]|nr:FAD binding domain-containing protein [Pseudonocardiaceae bacterium]